MAALPGDTPCPASDGGPGLVPRGSWWWIERLWFQSAVEVWGYRGGPLHVTAPDAYGSPDIIPIEYILFFSTNPQ